MADYSILKAGSSRKEVDKNFELDGGLQFTFQNRYVYKKCAYIHVDIEFKRQSSSSEKAPADTVVTVSKLYLEYPAKD